MNRTELKEVAMNNLFSNELVLPEWILLRHRIKVLISQLLPTSSDGRNHEMLREDIAEINHLIGKFNTLVPDPILHKNLLTPDNLEEQYDLVWNWRGVGHMIR